MTALAQQIVLLINEYVRNYAQDAFSNLNLNRILNLMVQLADANAGGTGPTNNLTEQYAFTSADFSDPANPTSVPSAALNGLQYSVFVNELQRFLVDSEMSLISGGGFKINITGFDPSTTNYHIIVTINTATGGLLLPVTSSLFTGPTTLPLAQFVNKKLAIFWNEGQRYLLEDLGDFSYLPGGGVTILVTGFDSTTTNYHLYVSAL